MSQALAQPDTRRRFTLKNVAGWIGLAGLIALGVAAAVVLIVTTTHHEPTGTLGTLKYTGQACVHVPRREELVTVNGFRPLSQGQVAAEWTRNLGSGAPVLVYVLDASNRCVTEYVQDGGG